MNHKQQLQNKTGGSLKKNQQAKQRSVQLRGDALWWHNYCSIPAQSGHVGFSPFHFLQLQQVTKTRYKMYQLLTHKVFRQKKVLIISVLIDQ